MKISTICFPVKDGKVFLSKKKRGFGAGYLNGYGGKQQPEDKTIEDTSIREMKEESGVDILYEGLEKVAVIDFFEGGSHVFECHVFFCRRWEGDLIETEEMAKPIAYDLNNPPFAQMWQGDRTWFPLICAGQKIRARSFYKEGLDIQERFEYETLV